MLYVDRQYGTILIHVLDGSSYHDFGSHISTRILVGPSGTTEPCLSNEFMNSKLRNFWTANATKRHAWPQLTKRKVDHARENMDPV